MLSKPIIAQVNCDEATSTCERFSIRSYPTLIFIKNGKTYGFKGGRTLEVMREFLEGGYVNSFEIQDVPKELGRVDYYLKMFRLAIYEIFDAFNPIFAHFGLKNPPFWMKLAAVLTLLLAPSFFIVGCIFWCESRQLKGLETRAGKQNQEEIQPKIETNQEKNASTKEDKDHPKSQQEKTAKAKKID
jgi:hypothetical protein